MTKTLETAWRGARRIAFALLAASIVTACGGGTEGAGVPADDTLEAANSATAQTVLHAVPPAPAAATATIDPARKKAADVVATSLRVHYRRLHADYGGWQIHTWNAAQSPAWNAGWNATGSDDFGVYYDVPLAASSGTVGYLFHAGDTKDDNGADQAYVLAAGANEIWRVEGDLTTYPGNPLTAPVPDITTLRVHYTRFANDYANWGLHLWAGSGLDTARMGAIAYGDWNNPTPFGAMPRYASGSGEIVFDVPVLDPRTNPGTTSIEFLIHGMPPNVNDKDGRSNNIHVDLGSLTVVDQVGQVWLVEQDATVYTSPPDLRSVSTTDARAVWLNGSLVKWPHVAADGPVKLYWSATGAIVAAKDRAIAGADGSITLDPYTAAVPAAAATRFKYVGNGGVFSVRAADAPRLKKLLTHQVVLAQEDAAGAIQNATTAQVAGALDDLYAPAASSAPLGATVERGRTTFRLWAPTARNVSLYAYLGATAAAKLALPMSFDAATGVWSLTIPGEWSGLYYMYGVQVFVRGTGVVRNIVTDPYSLSLSADSLRSQVIDLSSHRLKPEDWDETRPPRTVAGSTDMAIYELHVRDFSDNDPTVPAAHRGKFMAFTDVNSNGMRHLRALAQAGLTDVHLMPSFDIASVPETGCVTPAPSGAPDSPSQQAAVAATASTDCYNWGYDPLHFTSPEGSYATSVADGSTRVIEFRRMVQSLNRAGLRVGMDVVFNHTSASGQAATSVLDRVVPGYYYRLDAVGNVLRDSCCDDTATENMMMGRLMTDSVVTWARDYHVSSFRFDIMGLQPRDAMVALQARVDAAVGHHVELIGEGWNFGAVANGARFVQADMLDLNGTGVGTFNPALRDAIRGGGCCDSGNALIANQGYINGLFYDPNAQGSGHSAGDLMWLGDVIKAGLAGSIRSYSLTTSWDAQLPLEQITFEGLPAGYVTSPSEVVNYFENHDNLTIFDNNVYKLPTATSREDRARVQMLGAAITAFSQGVAYFHAGVDTLRSKSLDGNSYDSGDWFNRLDWRYADDNFGVGLPPAPSNQASWPVQQPLLADTAIKPTAAEIAWARDEFRDLLRIRRSTTLLRMASADDIKARLRFYNTGSQQIPTLLVGDLDGRGYAGANFQELTYFVNVDKAAHAVTIPALAGREFQLHPVHASFAAADKRAAQATYDGASGTFSIPARTAVAFVVRH